MSRLVKIKLALVDRDHLIANQPYITDASGQWERKLLNLTIGVRPINLERTFERGQIKIIIDDIDETYQTMMADDTNRKIYNKVVTVYIYKPDGVTLQETLVANIISWQRTDGEFEIACEQNFSGALPQIAPVGNLKIDATTWPYAPKTSLGKEVTYPMGVIYQRLGGMICYRVDKAPAAKYLITKSDPASSARVVSIQSAFINGAKQYPSAYSLVRNANGWEYILFGKRVTPAIRVNLTANASVASAGNPVDCLREKLTAVGVTLVDSGDVFKTYCDTNLWSISGTPTDIKDVGEYVELWCQNFDCFHFIKPAGTINIKHIDWAAITAVATLSDRHFETFKETVTMNGFANRIKASLEYDYVQSKWGTIEIVNSTAGDYLPATTIIEKNEEYAIGSFAGAVKPMASKLRYIDHPLQTAVGSIKQDLYEQLALSVADVITIDHYLQIGGSGKYLIMREDPDIINGDITITSLRLWGV